MLFLLFILTVCILLAGLAGFFMRRYQGIGLVSLILVLNAVILLLVSVDRLSGLREGHGLIILLLAIVLIMMPLITRTYGSSNCLDSGSENGNSGPGPD